MPEQPPDFIDETGHGDTPDVTESFAVLNDLPNAADVASSMVERARRGDRDAIDELVRSHARMVERLLHRMLGPRHDMDDLVQTVFLELCRALPGFKNESRFSSFLGGIAAMVARRAMRPLAFDRHRAPIDENHGARTADPESSVVDRRRIAALHRALSSVSENQRIAFTLWALEGIEPKVIAEMTGASLSATRSRIFYAQRALREAALADADLAEWLGGGDDAP